METTGFTKRFRKRWSTGYHRDHTLWVLIDYLIDSAAWKREKQFVVGFGTVMVERGQAALTSTEICEFLGISRQKLRARLKKLEDDQFLTIKTTNKFSIYSIINYDTYQSCETQNNQQTNQLSTNKQPTEQLHPFIEEYKNIKENYTKEKKSNGGSPPCPHDEIIQIYHEILPELPRVRVWSEASKAALSARWRQSKDYQTLDFWTKYFTKVSRSDFLTGRKTEWKSSLSWLVKASSFEKVMNGNYENQKKQEYQRETYTQRPIEDLMT